jgi:hypothetical protein
MAAVPTKTGPGLPGAEVLWGGRPEDRERPQMTSGVDTVRDMSFQKSVPPPARRQPLPKATGGPN